MTGKSKKQHLSIKHLMILVFIVFLTVAVTVNGAVIYSNWRTSAAKSIENLAADINQNIHRETEAFLHLPHHLNEVNYLVMEHKILDLEQTKQREQFFVSVLMTHPDSIYSFSYGTVNGEYYGARRNLQGEIEIMRNNAGTGGESWYYSVKEDLSAGELAARIGPFDPRTRDWYMAAAAAGEPVFSPVYTHFIMADLTLSAAWPVYDEAGALHGVMGTHFLLSDINGSLEDAISRYGGHALLIEKDTHLLIGNSLGSSNFTELDNGSLDRLALADIENPDLIRAFEQYEVQKISSFRFSGSQGTYYISVREIGLHGVEWLLISAVPVDLFTADIITSMLNAAKLSALILLLLLLVYMVLIRRLLQPLSNLLTAASAYMDGDLTKRVPVNRRDEVGLISESFNNATAKMQGLINNLEENVSSRTKELQEANLALDQNRRDLRLILDTTAEAVYGIDIHGRCTFCNASGVKMLGYSSEEELIGKDMHLQIHHTRQNGEVFPSEKCRIFQSINLGTGIQADDEIFWRADGTSFNVEYRAQPQMKDGMVAGGVITFMDITDRKKRDEEIQYLSQHDPLTGLYNRRYFEKAMASIDTPENLPLSVIFADINGLKITNDIFGHEAGDALITRAAEILSRSCRDNDVVARIGGDEFIILLPNTTNENAQRILDRIKAEFENVHVEAIRCSVAIGADTKYDLDQSLEETMANAENSMYKDKTLNRKLTNKEMINTIVESLHAKNPRERQHAHAVEQLCGRIGAALGMPASEIEKLRRAGFLHDIGKITLKPAILAKDMLTDEEEHAQVQQHALVRYRLLSLIDDTMDLAEYVYNHHEHWDGTGHPRGIKGEQIPLISRIIAIAETYERALNRTASLQAYTQTERKQKAITVIQDQAGSRFDPKIARLFVRMMKPLGFTVNE